MANALGTCFFIVLVFGGTFWVVLASWWRRTNPPDDRLRQVAEAIVADQYALLADLYETPPQPAPGTLRARADR